MEGSEWFQATLLFFSSLVFLVCSFSFLKTRANPKIHPPAPPCLPVIGHLHLLREPFHRNLKELSTKYGDVLLLRLGSRKVLVISSASAAEELFAKNDVVFANRPRTMSSEILHYDSTTVAFAPYGEHWRNLRRLVTIEVFSTRSVEALSGIRQQEACFLVKQMFDESGGKNFRVELRSKLVDLAFNIVMRVLVGKRYCGKDVVSEEGRRVKEMIRELGELHGSASSLGDFIPILRWIDFLGVKERMTKAFEKVDTFMQHLVDIQRSTSIGSSAPSLDIDKTGTRRTCLINRMLSLQQDEPSNYSDYIIKGVLQIMLLAGTDTTSTTAEWAMALLLNHPETLAKARTEIDLVVGHNCLIDDPDLQNLPYLQNIITETLRLYPPVPLLLPHESSQDSTVRGFHVPRSTMLIVNSWSIHRDPKVWADPDKFLPERFEPGGRESGGGEGGCKWVPFGVGKRACPGAMFGRRTVGLILGTLIQCFEWRRVGEEPVDMAEGTGLTITPVVPVEALCKPRETMVQLLSNLKVNNEGFGDT